MYRCSPLSLHLEKARDDIGFSIETQGLPFTGGQWFPEQNHSVREYRSLFKGLFEDRQRRLPALPDLAVTQTLYLGI